MPKIVIPSDLDSARRVERVVLGEIARGGYSDCEAFGIRLSLEEALNKLV